MHITPPPVASAAVRSKAVAVDSLFIIAPIICGVSVLCST